MFDKLDNFLFRNLLGENETIVYVARVHPFIFSFEIIKFCFYGLLIPVFFYWLLPPMKFLWLLWFSVAVLLLFYRFLQWYLDAWIITDQAVIDREWNSFFDERSSRIEFGNIEGIASEIRGFWATILRFGMIQIVHVSGQPIVLEDVASPRKVERIVQTAQANFAQSQLYQDHSKLKDLLISLVRKL